ncbi:hypothetical protein G6F40_015913 [Rhizopus arrhizus]|nr:hypothetical protein G6F40_015913 [Rhizopus arrhizus]KAG1228379.1 hypothetical protein G6F68_019490 [Rhizopus microsporus]
MHASVHIFLRRQTDPGADDRTHQARSAAVRHAIQPAARPGVFLVLRLHGHSDRLAGRPLFAAEDHRDRGGVLEPGHGRLWAVAQFRADVPGAHRRGRGRSRLVARHLFHA